MSTAKRAHRAPPVRSSMYQDVRIAQPKLRTVQAVTQSLEFAISAPLASTLIATSTANLVRVLSRSTAKLVRRAALVHSLIK